MVLLPRRESSDSVYCCLQHETCYPLHVKDEVDIIGMASDEECEKEMFVTIRWEMDGLAAPLSQLTPASDTATQTKQAVEDWHYWVQMGYQFS